MPARATAQRGGTEEWEPDDELHQQLAHLRWRKHVNETNIRKAIDTSKRLQERDLLLQLSVDRAAVSTTMEVTEHEERGRWAEAVIRDELARPMQVSEPYLKEWEETHRKTQQKCLREAKLHLTSIKRLEGSLKSRKPAKREAPEDVQPVDSTPSHDCRSLEDRLKELRVGIKENRRLLRRASRKSRMQTSFSASNFKSGRGIRI